MSVSIIDILIVDSSIIFFIDFLQLLNIIYFRIYLMFFV